MKKNNGSSTVFGNPGAFAVARNQAGGDIMAAALLFRLKFYFRPEAKIKKLERFDKEWIAMSRSDWAREAGLSECEMKNRALPRLRKRQFVTIRQMKLSHKGPKMLCMSLDLEKLHEWTDPHDTFENILNGMTGPGYEKPPHAYPYKNGEEWAN
jgi:hypothetical protein